MKLPPDGGGGGGIHVDPHVIFKAATGLVATKDYAYGIETGIAGDLQASAGMAGDDQIAHDFAAKYEPVARNIVAGTGNAGQGIGVTAAKLLQVATDYLNVDLRASGRIAGKVDASSYAKPPQPDCEPQNAAASLPMITGSKEVHEIPVIGKFWPQGSPDKLRATAKTWELAADRIDDAQRNAERHVQPIWAYWHGEAAGACQMYIRKLWSADPTGADIVSDGQPLMENLSAACRRLQKACNTYADAIDDCRHTLIALAVGAGIITGAGILLTVFTLGGSDAAAASADAALAAEAAAAAEALAAAEADAVAGAAIAEAEAVLDSALAKMAAAGMFTLAAVGVAADSASAAPGTPVNLAGAPLDIATVPPLPAGPPSGHFPPYTPQQQAAARAWLATLNTGNPKPTDPGDLAYQIRVAGQPEREVPTGLPPGVGSTVWADGYRPLDGALVEAKHIRKPGCSPRTLNRIQENDRATGFLLGKDDDEIARYALAVKNPANHTQYLEIDVDDETTVGYWQYLAAQNGVPNDVRYIP